MQFIRRQVEPRREGVWEVEREQERVERIGSASDSEGWTVAIRSKSISKALRSA